MTKVSYDSLLNLTEEILAKGLGYSIQEARSTATVLVEADARGIPSHGVSRLAFYRQNIQDGHAKPGAEPEIVWSTPCSLVVDGHNGVGCHISQWSVARMLELAKNTGTAFCAVRNSNHYGIAGWWAEEIARHDMIGMAFTNTRVCGTPTFGRGRVLGTNPIAVAIPEKDGKMFLLDMATTTVAHGKIEVYDRRKKAMPLGWVVDENGRGTTDATAFEEMFTTSNLGGHLYLGGEGEETGGHKGFGLALLVELLCTGLSMGISSLHTFGPGGGGITHFFAAMRLDMFGPAESIKNRMAQILDEVRHSEKMPGHDRIWIHGEKEAEARELSLRDGIYLDEATVGYLKSLSNEFNLDLPSSFVG